MQGGSGFHSYNAEVTEMGSRKQTNLMLGGIEAFGDGVAIAPAPEQADQSRVVEIRWSRPAEADGDWADCRSVWAEPRRGCPAPAGALLKPLQLRHRWSARRGANEVVVWEADGRHKISEFGMAVVVNMGAEHLPRRPPRISAETAIAGWGTPLGRGSSLWNAPRTQGNKALVGS